MVNQIPKKVPAWQNGRTELENEFKDPAKHIVRFVSAGAKNFGFITNKGLTQLKIRGFTQNQISDETLNMETMMNVVSECGGKSVEVSMGTTIQRNVHERRLFTKENKQMSRMVFDKRVVSEDIRKSVPYGYKPPTLVNDLLCFDLLL